MESAFLLLLLHPLRALPFSKQHFLKGGFSQEHFFFHFSNPPNKCAMKRFRHSMVSWGKGHDVAEGAEGWEWRLELKTVRLVRTFGLGSTAAGWACRKSRLAEIKRCSETGAHPGKSSALLSTSGLSAVMAVGVGGDAILCCTGPKWP